MTSFFRPRAVAVASILAAVAALCYYDSIPPASGLFFFETTLSTPQEAVTQLFYDNGHGYREKDSVRLPLPGKNTPTVCRFPLPTGKYRGFRFDPINHGGTVDFKGARIVDQAGSTVREFAPGLFQPDHQIASLTLHEGGLRMVASGADPFLSVDSGDPFVLRDGSAILWNSLQAALAFPVVFFAVLAAAAVTWRPRWPGLQVRENGFDPWLTGGALALVTLKLWLASAQTLYGMGGAGHDDQLFVNQAHELLNGHWLGTYSQFTLMKGPMYSFLLAGSFLLGVPFFTTLRLLYAAACLVMLRALRPLVPHRGLRFAIFTVLLFNPVSYESVVHARLLRQNLIPALALMIVAALIGLYARRAERPRRLAPWALLAGVALGTFWLTREESVWILPCAGLIGAATAVAMWRLGGPERKARLAWLAAPVLLCVLATSTVAWINLRHYGVFTTCEFKETAFKDGFGALMRVEPVTWRPYLPVTKESRARIYAESPAFAELRPYLEGDLGEGWAAASEGLTHLPAREHEMAVGWFMWAVRDAVALAGHCQNGADAMAYYARLAREVNEACDRGRLSPSGSRRSGFVPPLRPEYLKSFFQAWPDIAGFFASFDQMFTGNQLSLGDPEQLKQVADLTRERLGPMADGPPIPPLQHSLDDTRLGWLGQISRLYHLAAPWAGAAAGLALLAATGLAVVQRRLPFALVASVGLLGSIAALITAITLIQVTSFPAVNTGYFSGAYALWLLFMFSGWLALHEMLPGKPHPPST